MADQPAKPKESVEVVHVLKDDAKAKPEAKPATKAERAAADTKADVKADRKDPVVAEARLDGTVQSGTVTPDESPVGGEVPGSGGEKSPLVKQARLDGTVQSGTTSPYYPPEK